MTAPTSAIIDAIHHHLPRVSRASVSSDSSIVTQSSDWMTRWSIVQLIVYRNGRDWKSLCEEML